MLARLQVEGLQRAHGVQDAGYPLWCDGRGKARGAGRTRKVEAVEGWQRLQQAKYRLGVYGGTASEADGAQARQSCTKHAEHGRSHNHTVCSNVADTSVLWPLQQRLQPLRCVASEQRAPGERPKLHSAVKVVAATQVPPAPAHARVLDGEVRVERGVAQDLQDITAAMQPRVDSLRTTSITSSGSRNVKFSPETRGER